MCLGQEQLQSEAETFPCPTFKQFIVSLAKHLPVRVKHAHYEDWAILFMQRNGQ